MNGWFFGPFGLSKKDVEKNIFKFRKFKNSYPGSAAGMTEASKFRMIAQVKLIVIPAKAGI